MLRRLLVAGLVSGALVAASGNKPAEAYVSVDVNLHFGDDTFWFDQAPRFVAVPYSTIQYAPGPDCDIYRYGDWYYVNNGYDWYRGPGYAGPFTRITYVAVPRPVVAVPVRYKHYSRQYVTTDPWANRWVRSGGRDGGNWYERHYGRSYPGSRDRDGNWSRGDRDDRRDDRYSQRNRGKDDDDRGKGHGKGKGKNKGRGNGRAYGRS